MKEREQLTATFGIELREAQVEQLVEQRELEALIVPYGETSFDTPHEHGERFLSGSFVKTVAQLRRPIKLFRAHDHSRPIGLSTSLDAENELGLVARFKLAEIPAADDTIVEIRAGLLDSMSVGFQAIQDRVSRVDRAREIVEARLLEASVLAIGAYDGARVLAMRDPSSPDPELLERIKLATALPAAPTLDLSRPLLWR